MEPTSNSSGNRLSGLQMVDPEPGTTYTLEAVCHLTGVSRRTVLIYLRHGLIRPLQENEEHPLAFTEEAIYLIRQGESLRDRHGINMAGLRMVFRLLREIEDLRREMRFLR
jgi:DNA-binding transcriptional MerR regulator